MSVLQPCPFCGRAGTRMTTRADGLFRARCGAIECEARGPTARHPEDAMDLWNHLVPRTGPEAFEHWTCGTGHLRAERTLRLIAQVGATDLDAMEMLAGLVAEAGVANARIFLAPLDDDVPF